MAFSSSIISILGIIKSILIVCEIEKNK